MTIRRLGTTLILGLGLASCQVPHLVVLGPDLSALGPPLEAAQKAGLVAPAWKVVAEGSPVPEGAQVVRLTTSPQTGDPVPRSTLDQAGFVAPSCLIRLSQNDRGDWARVPLLFDVWGQSRPADNAAVSPDWRGLLAQAPAGGLVAAGSRPSFRQWAYAAQVFPAAGLDPQALKTLVVGKAWRPETWNLAATDLLPTYRPDPRATVVETYRDFESRTGGPNRSYAPVALQEDGHWIVGGTVVFAEVRGAAASGDAWALVAALSAPAVQKVWGTPAGWLSANLNAPERDGAGAVVRGLVNQAVRFLPTTDAVDSAGAGFPAELQRAVDAAPRR